MSNAHTRAPRGVHALSVLMLAVLAGCGGGGGGSDDPAAEAPTSAAPPAEPVVVTEPVTDRVTDPATESADVTEPADVVDDGQAATDPVVPDLTVIAGASTGRILYVDARTGSDANNGLAQTQVSAGNGPWQTLAKANAAALPGDTIRLACGASWNETIKPAKSGTSTARITFTSYPAGCATPAAVDGADYLAPAAWIRQEGNVYKAMLPRKPLQVLPSTGTMLWAHHPNRGFDATAPNSLYLRNAVDANTVTVNGVAGSTYVTTGSDLAMPAGATIGAGTTIRIRPNAWTLDETTVTSFSGGRLTLAAATTYPLKAGWGYYLAGQRWMLDSPGEWFWDSSAQALYAWMPDSAAPRASVRATTRDVGVNLNSLWYVTIDGVAVRHTGTGVTARNSGNVVLRNMRIEDIAGIGIDANLADAPTISSNTISRTERDAVYAPGGRNVVVTGNRISQAGVLMSGGKVVSLPRRTQAGISAGTNASITQNTLTDTGYNGISFSVASRASYNTITGACSTLDDGAGIYTSRAGNNSFIEGNVVMDVRGAPEGKGTSTVVSEGKGIYLDEQASGVTVRNNTIVNADHGIKLHIAAGNTVSGNTVYGNRRSQIMFYENTNVLRPTGDVFDNAVTANSVVPTRAEATGFLHETTIRDATLFARYDTNVYFDRLYSRIGVEKTPAGEIEYSFKNWQAATFENGAARNQDVNGRAASSISYATALVAGPSVVPNGTVSASLYGWDAYNDTQPRGVLSRVACPLGYCVQYTAGGSSGLVSSPYFSVVKDRWYRITVDVQGSVSGQILNLVLRRGGGGTNGYEALSPLYAYVPISTGWTRLTYTVLVNKTINANDPVTLDRGARIDFGSTKPGQWLRIANVEMVPVTMSQSSTRTDLLVNASGYDATLACPTAASDPTLCGQYFSLRDNQPVSWPRVLTPRSSDVVYTLDRTLIDGDRDGIADSQDRCPGTAASASVNAAGCALSQ